MGMVAHAGKLWLAGGENITAGELALGDVWSSDDGVNWTDSGVDLGKRGNPSLRSYAGKLWLAGGWQYYDAFHVTNHYANDLLSSADGITWTTNTADAPWYGRRAHSMEFIGNRLLLFAGENGQTAQQSSKLREIWETSGDFPHQTADVDGDLRLSISELLRLIQFYNAGGLRVAAGTEDGFAPGVGDTTGTPHQSDYAPQDWQLQLSELLRAIQFHNAGGYTPCETGEDGFCPGP